MIDAVIERQIRKAETETGENADWMRDIARNSRVAAVKFAMFLPLAAHRMEAHREIVHVARLAATRSEDCGPCLQTVVNHALQDGVEPNIVRSIVADDLGALPPLLADVYRFAAGVARHKDFDEQLRQSLLRRCGEAVMVDVALAIAATRVFPTVKRALGYAHSCAHVTIKVDAEEAGAAHG